MKRAIVVQPAADTDIDEIFEYIRADRPSVALRFLDSFWSTADGIREFPEIGVLRYTDHPRLKNVRIFAIKRFEKYLIFYRVSETAIEVLRVLHSAQEIEEILEREGE